MAFSPLFVGSVGATGVRETRTFMARPFQSPFRRVSGCNKEFKVLAMVSATLSVPFSSGQWVQRKLTLRRVFREKLSVPFSSGQWVQRTFGRETHISLYSPFSPLFVGSVGATQRPAPVRVPPPAFSPLFVGSVGATMAANIVSTSCSSFQSPFRRVSGCNWLLVACPL